ncbi:MAG: zinc ribbon domain-containing protein [Lachnospiraceae bacterium]|nr:zinc ribbon domain-containing protein [Lachnospiraceae bacterium]
MVIGYILTVLGILGSVLTVNYMSHDRYTYTAPLTSHETMVFAVFIVFAVMAAAGILTIIFSLVKKKNQDTLNRITDMDESGKRQNVCPVCGLNLAEGARTCPKCGKRLL